MAEPDTTEQTPATDTAHTDQQPPADAPGTDQAATASAGADQTAATTEGAAEPPRHTPTPPVDATATPEPAKAQAKAQNRQGQGQAQAKPAAAAKPKPQPSERKPKSGRPDDQDDAPASLADLIAPESLSLANPEGDLLADPGVEDYHARQAAGLDLAPTPPDAIVKVVRRTGPLDLAAPAPLPRPGDERLERGTPFAFQSQGRPGQQLPD